MGHRSELNEYVREVGSEPAEIVTLELEPRHSIVLACGNGGKSADVVLPFATAGVAACGDEGDEGDDEDGPMAGSAPVLVATVCPDSTVV